VCTIGLGLLIAALRANQIETSGGFHPGPDFDATAVTLRGVYLAQLAIGVLGVLVITGEYSTGMIRATLSAVPRRLPVLWAKAAVFAVVVFVTMGISSLIAFEGGAACFSGAGIHISLSSPGAARAVLGAALYLTVILLMGVGLGFLIRNTAGAISALFGLMLLLPPIVSALPLSLYNDIYKYLPLLAGSQVMTTVSGGSSVLSPWAGMVVFTLYAVAAIGLGAVVLKRRDA
jgi:ABC-2 type transport system permease protein